MILRMLTIGLGIALVALLSGTAAAQNAKAPDHDSPQPRTKSTEDPNSEASANKIEDEKPQAKKAAKPTRERATFGGGCFWCMEAVFEQIPGVKSVVSGYEGGSVARPSYQMVHSGLTGHAEVVQIDFDPEVVTFDKLLEIFFEFHDPTTLNRQGVDVGTQYRSVIFFHGDAQRKSAMKLYEKLTNANVFANPIVTELVPAMKFYPAETYHQDYYRKNRSNFYCQVNIAPKLQKLKLHALQEQQQQQQAKSRP